MSNSTNQASGNPPARRFGKYILNRLLGEGAMGIVYLTQDIVINRPVALKITRFSRSQDARLVERFQREARAAGRLKSPYICAVHDVGNINDE